MDSERDKDSRVQGFKGSSEKKLKAEGKNDE
jgi:hypothetical protein